MRVLNFGSLNIDHVYSVQHVVRPGETIHCRQYRQFCGGKGLNQSIALALAGAETFHAGKIGPDGAFLKERLAAAGVHTEHVITIPDEVTGRAIIQVDEKGQNAIFLYGGANLRFLEEDVAQALSGFSSDDCLLVQNEVSRIPDMIHQAKERNMTVFFNPAPANAGVLAYPLHEVDYFIINEIEGAELTDKTGPDDIVGEMRRKFPQAAVILTLGENGVIYADSDQVIRMPAEKTTPVDTTAAGDTFVGYFIAGWSSRNPIDQCLSTACKASAICVTRPGAADSIPTRAEVEGSL